MTETYLNSTPRGCSTCLFKQTGELSGAAFWRCGKTGYFCTTMRGTANAARDCDEHFSGWAPIPPKPPRRSLRHWLYDLFLA